MVWTFETGFEADIRDVAMALVPNVPRRIIDPTDLWELDYYIHCRPEPEEPEEDAPIWTTATKPEILKYAGML